MTKYFLHLPVLVLCFLHFPFFTPVLVSQMSAIAWLKSFWSAGSLMISRLMGLWGLKAAAYLHTCVRMCVARAHLQWSPWRVVPSITVPDGSTAHTSRRKKKQDSECDCHHHCCHYHFYHYPHYCYFNVAGRPPCCLCSALNQRLAVWCAAKYLISLHNARRDLGPVDKFLS